MASFVELKSLTKHFIKLAFDAFFFFKGGNGEMAERPSMP
jgi:hypothetical protein